MFWLKPLKEELAKTSRKNKFLKLGVVRISSADYAAFWSRGSKWETLKRIVLQFSPSKITALPLFYSEQQMLALNSYVTIKSL